MIEPSDSVTVVVIDPVQYLVATNLDSDTAQTLIALVSEDPANWQQAQSVWPRYRTQAVCEFIDSLPLNATAREAAFAAQESSELWVVIDFVDKRVFTSEKFTPLERHAVFAMHTDDNGDQHWPLSIHLPPWWELHAGSANQAARLPRQTPIDKPFVNRAVLYGEPLLKFIAEETIAAVASNSWRTSGAQADGQARYPFTLEVHRNWLMRPRPDLDGKYPRQVLHGAIHWNERVTWGQRLRYDDDGPMIAAPNDWPGYENAPVGSQEICVYFDMCRALIGASWEWLVMNQTEPDRQPSENTQQELIEALRVFKTRWLNRPSSSGSIPNFVLECDRRRVPRGVGVPIEGIVGVQGQFGTEGYPGAIIDDDVFHDDVFDDDALLDDDDDEWLDDPDAPDEPGSRQDKHQTGCDCPICEMMGDGLFGTCFTCIDGHHLEMDNEFAFSMAETFEQWQEQQREFEEMDRSIKARMAERELHRDESDEFGSVWPGFASNQSLPNVDRHLTLAFKIAELISDLHSLNVTNTVPSKLNECFANFRRSEDSSRSQHARELTETLEAIALDHPSLTAKSADLQSLIDDCLRSQ